MDGKQLRVLMIGAHPDDCEFQTGGIALKYRALGHTVKFVSVTNGDTGHYELSGGRLAAIRAGESGAACATAGIESQVLDIHSNGLEADIPTREKIIVLIRQFKPDIIFTHRLNDYHPDHRRTAMLVQDSSYAIRVPNVCPLVPSLKYTPAILYMNDSFRKPTGLEPCAVIGIDDVMEGKTRMLDCHKSQVYEWLPWMDGELEQVPEDAGERLVWLQKKQEARDGRTAERFRNMLSARYGEEHGLKIKCAEAFELSEYGAQLSEQQLKEYFPF